LAAKRLEAIRKEVIKMAKARHRRRIGGSEGTFEQEEMYPYRKRDVIAQGEMYPNGKRDVLKQEAMYPNGKQKDPWGQKNLEF